MHRNCPESYETILGGFVSVSVYGRSVYDGYADTHDAVDTDETPGVADVIVPSHLPDTPEALARHFCGTSVGAVRGASTGFRND
ncbi:hypothetical protein JCM4914_33190 [Streptomyces platensis subsp. malvinus]